MAHVSSLRGYGTQNLVFSGESQDFELWSVKFKGMIRLQKLHTILESSADTVDDDKNAQLFAHLVQCLDNKSINLIIRDAMNKGREAYNILEEHHIGTSKPRIISLYTELTTLRMSSNETVTDYVLRAENASTRLKQAKENISDMLLIAMVLKGLPSSFKSFCTLIDNIADDSMTFSQFKTKLRSYEENEAAREVHAHDEVLTITCFNCGKPGHKAPNCKNPKKKSPEKSNASKQKRWCSHCNMSNHNTDNCGILKRQNTTKNLMKYDKSYKMDEEEEIVFKLIDWEEDSINKVENNDQYLIDCGATVHIISDPNKFVSKDDS